MDRGYGGFPGPQVLLLRLFRQLFPNAQRRFVRRVTIPHTTSIQSAQGSSDAAAGVKSVPYISFDAIVGRNSRFHMLSDENLEELGGVEYRALNALLWIVGGVCIMKNASVLVRAADANLYAVSHWRTADLFYRHCSLHLSGEVAKHF